MNANNGWPGKPGVPLNPEKDGWHWLQDSEGNKECVSWRERKFLGDGRGGWSFIGYEDDFQPHEIRDWTYLGPVLLPAEATALQARADRNAAGFARVDAEAERDKFLHKQEIAALQKRVAELEGALRMAAECIDADDTISARGFLSDALIKKHKPKWVCPNNTHGCVKNCGNYGCGN